MPLLCPNLLPLPLRCLLPALTSPPIHPQLSTSPISSPVSTTTEALQNFTSDQLHSPLAIFTLNTPVSRPDPAEPSTTIQTESASVPPLLPAVVQTKAHNTTCQSPRPLPPSMRPVNPTYAPSAKVKLEKLEAAQCKKNKATKPAQSRKNKTPTGNLDDDEPLSILKKNKAATSAANKKAKKKLF